MLARCNFRSSFPDPDGGWNFDGLGRSRDRWFSLAAREWGKATQEAPLTGFEPSRDGQEGPICLLLPLRRLPRGAVNLFRRNSTNLTPSLRKSFATPPPHRRGLALYLTESILIGHSKNAAGNPFHRVGAQDLDLCRDGFRRRAFGW